MDAKKMVNIDFKKMAETFREVVREKALRVGGSIVYAFNGKLVEEDPATGKITILVEPFNCH